MADPDSDVTDDTGRGGVLLRWLGLVGLGGLLARWLGASRCCDPGRAEWLGTPTWGSDGAMTNVVDVNDFLDAERPCYQHYPSTIAQAVLGVDPTGSRPEDPIELTSHPGAGSGETDVVIVRDVVGDDSVAAERFVLTFVDEGVTGGTPGVHRLVYGLRQVRCQPGRGHEDFDVTPCI